MREGLLHLSLQALSAGIPLDDVIHPGMPGKLDSVAQRIVG